MERHLAASFAFPFRGRGPRRWLVGSLLLLLLPFSLPLVFGYAVACVRAAAADPGVEPPAWLVCRRLLVDGVLASMQLLALTLPFAALGLLLIAEAPRWAAPAAPAVRLLAAAGGATLAAFLWGAAVLTLVPPTLARFALSGRAADLARLDRGVRLVSDRFTAWNVAVTGVVTGWLLGLAGIGLCAVGVLPGAFYAILVSAHACAALAPAEPPR